MTSLNRDNRDVTAFCAEFARTNQLSANETDALVDRSLGVVSWVNRFRRTYGFVSRYPEGHAQRVAVLEDLEADTRNHVERWGKLEVHLMPGHCETAEGFRIPNALGSDPRFTFFPLYRDGVARFLLGPGAGARELETLLRALETTDEDAFLLLWCAQNPSLRIEAAATMTAQAAGALSAANPNDPAAAAFVATLTAAAPFYTSGDLRPMFTTATLEGLEGHGIQPQRSLQMLTTPNGALTAPALSAEQAATIRALFDHPEDREARRAAIRQVQFNMGHS